jgi:Flp pilus assembly protein TadG
MVKISRLLKRFAKSQKGNVAIMFGLSLVPLVVAVGAAVDFVRFTAVHTQMQAALDAGTLAAAVAKDKTDAQRITIGKDNFAANMKQGEAINIISTVNFTIKGGTVVSVANLPLPTSFLAVAGINSVDVGATSEVEIPANKKAEIAFVLDYSGSMGEVSGSQVKYIAMKNAAIKLINDLTKDNPDKVKFALVPFSHRVYTSLPNAFVAGKGIIGTWTGCTQDRQSPYNLSDTAPSTADSTKWVQPITEPYSAWGCNGFVSRNLKVQPLTNDFVGLKSQLAAMTPYANTHVALGVEFGYHVLSPNAPYSEGVSYADKGTKKYMVVLTDGENTEPAFGPGGTYTVANGDDNLAALCSNAKASGITIISLAFDLNDSSQRQRLQTCATDPSSNFFVAKTSDEMAQAFQAITDGISATAFLSK